MEQVSKNCYKGELLTNPNDIWRLALEKRCIYHSLWGVKPAAIFLSMQFSIIMRLLNGNELWFVINKNRDNEQNSNDKKREKDRSNI